MFLRYKRQEYPKPPNHKKLRQILGLDLKIILEEYWDSELSKTSMLAAAFAFVH